MKPRFAMFYPDHTFVDDGKDVEIVFKVPEVWAYAPKDGMQAVMASRDGGMVGTFKGTDIYAVLPGGEPFGTNDIGPMLRSVGIAKYGLQIPDEEYDRVLETMADFRRAGGFE